VRAPRLVFVSGWACDAAWIAPAARALGMLGSVRAISLAELAGHVGGAEGVGANCSAYARGLSAFLGACPAATTLIGWSMGGMVALELLCSGQARPGALVLVGTTSRFRGGPDYDCGVSDRSFRAMQIGLGQAAERTLRSFFCDAVFPDSADDEELHGWVAGALRAGPEPLRRDLMYLRDTDLRARLGALRIPTLIVHGTRDRVISCAAARYMHGRIPGSRLVLVEGAGHGLPRQRAAEFAGSVARFLRATT